MSAPSAASSAAPTVYPGQAPPIAVITTTDHSGLVIMATVLGLTFVMVSSVIRYYVRKEAAGSFARDDIVYLLATIISIFQSAAVLTGVKHGLGKSVEDIGSNDLVQLQKAQYAGDLLYIFTLWLTKASAIFLFMRLAPNLHHMRVTRITLATTTLWAFVSIFMIALKCNLSCPWIYVDTQCSNLFLRWQIISSIDIITEVSLFLVSVYIIQGLHMPWERKATIIFAFGLRLPIIIPTAFRLYNIGITLSSTNPTFDAAIILVWTQIEMDYALIGATIPCLKPFIKATSTTFGATAIESPSGTAALKSAQAYGLSSIISSGRKRGSKLLSGTSYQNERGENKKTPQHTIQQLYAEETYGTGKTITDCTKNNDNHSMESYGSEQIIIRHAVDVTVDHT